MSAVAAVPAYAGIPLTGAKTRSVHVVTSSCTTVDWATHASAATTVVVLGGQQSALDAADALVAAGRSGETPVAVTAQGTTTEQRTVVATLESLARVLRGVTLPEPVVAVVGDVVDQRERLSWFESKPLFGWRALVPRTKEQAGALALQLRHYGAVPEEVPTISVEPPRTPQQMDRAIQGLVSGRYLWVAFTSVNAVRAVREKFEEYGLDARAFAGIKVAAVGEQTAAALTAFGVRPDLVPSGEQSSMGLLEDFPPYDSVFDPIDRVFLPRADIATETLAAGLVELGWEIDDVTAYRTVRAAPPAAEIREAIKGGGFDAVVFTSSSTVRNLVGIAGKPHTSTVIACIGPATAKTAEEHGLRVDVLAPTPSVTALCEALAEFGGDCSRGCTRGGRADLASVATARCRAPQGEVAAMTGPGYPLERPRRLRRTAALRRLVGETRLTPADLVLPLFVKEGLTEPVPVSAMPGVVQHTRDSLRQAALDAVEAGVGGLILFGVPAGQGQ